MQVDYIDLDVLLEIQRIDLEVIQARKARAAMPQRIEVMKVRRKRGEIAPKLGTVISLQEAKTAEITKVEDEDRGLAEKQERCQAEIDNAGADYRAIELHSKDMAGIVKRRVALEETLRKLNTEHKKICAVRVQVEKALAVFDQQEADLRASFQEQDNELVARVRELLAQRTNLVQKLDTELVQLYDDIAAKIGGVALGKLEENGTCSVCRSAIESGRLIELRAQAPLGTCPNCKRLLIVEK